MQEVYSLSLVILHKGCWTVLQPDYTMMLAKGLGCDYLQAPESQSHCAEPALHVSAASHDNKRFFSLQRTRMLFANRNWQLRSLPPSGSVTST